MSHAVIRVLLAVMIVLQWGCAGPRGEPFEPEIVDPARAVVYVFREARGGLVQRSVRVYINQDPAGPLLPGQFLSRIVAPAEVFVRVEGDSMAARSVMLKPGDAAYLQVMVPKFGPLRPTLEVVDGQTARPILSGTTRSMP